MIYSVVYINIFESMDPQFLWVCLRVACIMLNTFVYIANTSNCVYTVWTRISRQFASFSQCIWEMFSIRCTPKMSQTDVTGRQLISIKFTSSHLKIYSLNVNFALGNAYNYRRNDLECKLKNQTVRICSHLEEDIYRSKRMQLVVRYLPWK